MSQDAGKCKQKMEDKEDEEDKKKEDACANRCEANNVLAKGKEKV